MTQIQKLRYLATSLTRVSCLKSFFFLHAGCQSCLYYTHLCLNWVETLIQNESVYASGFNPLGSTGCQEDLPLTWRFHWNSPLVLAKPARNRRPDRGPGIKTSVQGGANIVTWRWKVMKIHDSSPPKKSDFKLSSVYLSQPVRGFIIPDPIDMGWCCSKNWRFSNLKKMSLMHVMQIYVNSPRWGFFKSELGKAYERILKNRQVRIGRAGKKSLAMTWNLQKQTNGARGLQKKIWKKNINMIWIKVYPQMCRSKCRSKGGVICYSRFFP